MSDLGVGHQTEIRQTSAQHTLRQPEPGPGGQTVADGKVGARHEFTGSPRVVRGRRCVGLHTHDPAVGVQRLGHHARPRSSRAAPHRNQDDVDVGQFGEDLQVGGSDTGDQRGFIGRTDKPHPPRPGEPRRVFGGGFKMWAVLHQVSTQRANRRGLHRVGIGRNDDDTFHAEPPRRIGQGLGVIAGRIPDDSRITVR